MLKTFLDKNNTNKEKRETIRADTVKQKPIGKYLTVGGVYQSDIMVFTEKGKSDQYALTFVNSTTGKGHTVLMGVKDAEMVALQTELFIKSHPDMKVIETDQGAEFINNKYATLMKKYKIHHRYTMVGKKTQNAKIENYNFQIRKLVNGLKETSNVKVPLATSLKNATTHINDYRKHNYKMNTIGDFFKPPILPPKREILKPKDTVLVKLFKPTYGMRFRAGEKRFNDVPRKVEHMVLRPGQTAKYKVEGYHNALFNRNELKKKVA